MSENRRNLYCLALSLIVAGWFVPKVTSAQVPAGQDADRSCLEIYPYLGIAIDNFSANSARQYFNQDGAGDTETRETFGLWFQYPLGRTDNVAGKNCDTVKNTELDDAGNTIESEPAAVWLYGLTAHGVRSAELDCENSKEGICSDAPPDRSLAILRDASSLEALFGIRWEFLDLQQSNSTLYVNLQTGFVSVKGDVDDAAEVSHLGFGARIRSGRYRNSFIEAGIGKNDLILENNTGRYKLNARLVDNVLGWFPLGTGKLIGFIHMSVDVDGHSGPDSIQTYLGLTY